MKDLIVITTLGSLDDMALIFGADHHMAEAGHYVANTDHGHIYISQGQGMIAYYEKDEVQMILEVIKDPCFYVLACRRIDALIDGLEELTTKYPTLIDDDHGFIGSIVDYLNKIRGIG